MTDQEIKQKLNKFTQDPDWVLMQQMILDYIEPLRDINNIDTSQPLDVIAVEVKGRQISYQKLSEFLESCRLLGQKDKITNSNSFK